MNQSVQETFLQRRKPKGMREATVTKYTVYNSPTSSELKIHQLFRVVDWSKFIPRGSQTFMESCYSERSSEFYRGFKLRRVVV